MAVDVKKSGGDRAPNRDDTGARAPANPRGGSHQVIAAECEAARMNAGVVAALEYLNARTRFRFTGVYHAEPPLLRNFFLFDRENPGLNVSGELSPLENTYCAITCSTEKPFFASDAPNDARLQGHPARDSVISYAGVPITQRSGGVWGSLCHFDVRPRLLPDRELEVLESVAPLFAQWLLEETTG